MFQAPSKKKKKNRNRDIDIIESVQEHLANIRKIQEDSERALGENPGDDPPMDALEKKNKKQKAKDWKKQKDTNQGKSDGKDQKETESGGNVPKETKMDKSEVNEAAESGVNKPKDKKLDRVKSEEVIEIDDSSSDGVEIIEEEEEFQPYDYTQGAKKLLAGKCMGRLWFNYKKRKYTHMHNEHRK